MEKSAIKRKQFRRKLKRRAAALAVGAAIMTGAMSGAPIAKVQAAESPTNVSPVKAQQAAQDSSRPPGQGWHQHKYGWPSSNDNQAWYQDGKIYYRNDNPHYWAYQFGDPVDFAKDQAGTYGFDASLDDFTLLTVTSRTALVEVKQHDTGKIYNVLLKRTFDRDWTIVDVHAI